MDAVIFVCLVAFVAILGTHIHFVQKSYEGMDKVRRAEYISRKIEAPAGEAWRFLRPLLQAALVLGIAIAVLSFFKLDLANAMSALNWDIRSLLAFAVVAAFCLSAIGGAEGAHFLKDVALVVIGFCFGGSQVVNKQLNTKPNLCFVSRRALAIICATLRSRFGSC